MFGSTRQAAVATVSPAEAHDLADAGKVHLIDVREAGEWDSGHIPGARHVPLSGLQSLAAGLPTDRPLVFYCLSGARSAQAIGLCRKLGLAVEGASNMAGGISAWRAHGLPVTR